MKDRNITHLKKLYIQFDNANNNKSWAVIIGLAVLIALGIVEKIVVAFLLVGHTHTDVDRIISYVVSHLRGKDIATLEKLKEYVLGSFNPKEENWGQTPPPKIFDQIFSMTDYEAMFQPSVDAARANIEGVMNISMLKMTLAENGKDVHIVYKEDSDKKGWLPRPVVLVKSPTVWNKYFRSKVTTFAAQRIVEHRPLKVRCYFYFYRLHLKFFIVIGYPEFKRYSTTSCCLVV